MDNKNIETILSALAEKIRDLELEVSLRDYDIKKLKEENAELKRQRDALCRKEAENA